MAVTLDLRVAPLTKISYFVCVQVFSHVYQYNHNQNHTEKLCFNNLKQKGTIRSSKKVGEMTNTMKNLQFCKNFKRHVENLYKTPKTLRKSSEDLDNVFIEFSMVYNPFDILSAVFWIKLAKSS